MHLIKTYNTDDWGSSSESDYADDTDQDRDYQPNTVSNEINFNFIDEDNDLNERNTSNEASTSKYRDNKLRTDSNANTFNFTKIGKQPENFPNEKSY